jgi:hypothetical protein
MTKVYHMLFTRDDKNGWCPQFGDFDRKTVIDEMGDTYSEFKKDDIVVLRLPKDSNDMTDHAKRMLDKHGRNIRL